MRTLDATDCARGPRRGPRLDLQHVNVSTARAVLLRLLEGCGRCLGTNSVRGGPCPECGDARRQLGVE